MEITVISSWIPEAIILKVRSSDTIKSVKEKIQGKEGIPTEDQVLKFYHQKLEDIKRLSYYSIENKSIIFLSIEKRGAMQIFVHTIDKIKLALDVRNTDTVKDVKKMIYDKISTPVDMQELFFNGENLVFDFGTLSQYNITPGCDLYLARKLNGFFDVVRM